MNLRFMTLATWLGTPVMSDATDDLSLLRTRLVALRAELRERLASAEIIEPAWLRMLSDAEVVIAAIDRDAADLEARS